jgi:hypothetical protein
VILTNDELARQYPRLFHMAEAGVWPSIQRHGLLSTSALLDLFEVRGQRRVAIEAARRPENITLQHPKHGTAVIRDQKPMSDSALEKCLRDGLRPEDWYRLLNRQVFFWLSRERLERLLGARAYRSRRHTILEIDSVRLLADHADTIRLAPINTGSTIFAPQPRGRRTFLAISEYPYDAWREKRGAKDAVVELAVLDRVKGIADYVVQVMEVGRAEPNKILFTLD